MRLYLPLMLVLMILIPAAGAADELYWVNPGGDAYHGSGCKFITSDAVSMPLEQAAKGRRPCRTCRPPRPSEEARPARPPEATRPGLSSETARLVPAESGTRATQVREDAPVAVVSQKQFNAGKVRAGTTIEHGFIIKNTGKGELRIISAKPG